MPPGSCPYVRRSCDGVGVPGRTFSCRAVSAAAAAALNSATKQTLAMQLPHAFARASAAVFGAASVGHNGRFGLMSSVNSPPAGPRPP